MASVRDVARFFIDYGEKSGEPMTNMRVNKMLYFAQGVHLAKEGCSLFDDDIEAWQWGPVVSSIYHRYKPFEARPIVDTQPGFNRDSFSESEYASLLDTARIYCVYTTSTLVGFSHKLGGPWDKTMKTTEKTIPIDLIKKEFSDYELDLFDISFSGIDVYDKRSADGVLLLPHEENDGEEWDEYDEI